MQLATIYFADMTEMFNIRDEFMRTRPVVSIVLIDNYDELTTNLSDSAISTLDAQLKRRCGELDDGAGGAVPENRAQPLSGDL